MHLKSSILAILLATLPTAAMAQEPVTVMIVGVYHMDNPGRDIHDSHADDVLTAKRQAQIAATVDALARFHPTKVDLEWSAAGAEKSYDQYIKGTLKPSRDESVQLGFRLAKESGASVVGINELMDFPYPAVQDYAKAHGETPILDAANAAIQALVDEEQQRIDRDTIGQVLRWMNDPAFARRDNNFYVTMLSIGGGTEQPGADLLGAWNLRNFHICANLVQHANPGDRIVVIYGAGHEFLLRRCIAELPGYKLVETNDYLPQ
ncbi:MAG: DUF5694 domain-containing protein [Rhizomicrobium sp.]